MKGKIFKNICYGLFVAFLFCLAANVDALESENLKELVDGTNSANAEVTIGTVEVPVYDVTIIWQDLTFNWAYDEETKEFGWRKPTVCTFYTSDREEAKEGLNEGVILYDDSACSNRVYGIEDSSSPEGNPATDHNYYYTYETNKSAIGIEDFTLNGQIVPSISWDANDKYAHVEATFEYRQTESVCTLVSSEDMWDKAVEFDVTLYSDSSCSNAHNSESGYVANTYYAFVNAESMIKVTGEIPDEARYSAAGYADPSGYRFAELEDSDNSKNNYTIYLSLKNDPAKEAVAPVSGEVLGNVTVSIRAR